MKVIDINIIKYGMIINLSLFDLCNHFFFKN